MVVASSAYDRVQWQPYLAGQAAGSGGHSQVGGHPIQPIFAVEGLTNNDYNNISLLSTEVSPAFIHLWRSGGWKVVNARMEEPGGGWRWRLSTKTSVDKSLLVNFLFAFRDVPAECALVGCQLCRSQFFTRSVASKTTSSGGLGSTSNY